MEEFLAAYIRVRKEDIRKNRANIAEKLGFLGRAVHGVNGRLWLRELNSRTGDRVVISSNEERTVGAEQGEDHFTNLSDGI